MNDSFDVKDKLMSAAEAVRRFVRDVDPQRLILGPIFSFPPFGKGGRGDFA